MDEAFFMRALTECLADGIIALDFYVLCEVRLLEDFACQYPLTISPFFFFLFSEVVLCAFFRRLRSCEITGRAPVVVLPPPGTTPDYKRWQLIEILDEKERRRKKKNKEERKRSRMTRLFDIKGVNPRYWASFLRRIARSSRDSGDNNNKQTNKERDISQ